MWDKKYIWGVFYLLDIHSRKSQTGSCMLHLYGSHLQHLHTHQHLKSENTCLISCRLCCGAVPLVFISAWCYELTLFTCARDTIPNEARLALTGPEWLSIGTDGIWTTVMDWGWSWTFINVYTTLTIYKAIASISWRREVKDNVPVCISRFTWDVVKNYTKKSQTRNKFGGSFTFWAVTAERAKEVPACCICMAVICSIFTFINVWSQKIHA